MKKTPGTEAFNAPVDTPVQAPEPRQRLIERHGGLTAPVSHRLPRVRGGTCERCGTLDPLVPAQFQYKLCPHFRGIDELRCSYCEETKNPTDVILHSVLNVAEHPYNPDQLVVWCDAYECSRKHEARFKVNR